MTNEEQVVRAFLARVFEDEDRGGRRSLADYQSEFPGHDEAIARAFERLGPASDSSLDTDVERLGPFDLLRELGRGGQGVVYLARDRRLDREVALKVLPGGWTDTMRQRFQREAQLASRLEHAHLAGVLDVGIEDGRPWIAMPFVAGRSLQQRLSEEGALSIVDAIRITREIAEGLGAAHEGGVVHRDVKPGNVLCAESGNTPAVLTDFGIARELDSSTATLTTPGELVGTLHYVAPEVLEGQRADPRSDIWSLGVLLHECLTGEAPFDAPTEGALIRAILNDPPPKIGRRIPRDLATVLETALQKEPKSRYRSAVEFAADLRAVEQHRGIQARRSGALTRLRRFVRREPWLATTALGLFLVLGAGLGSTLSLLADTQTERDAKDRALGELEQLADQSRLVRLRGQISGFEPPWPGRVPEMREWLDRADELLALLPRHREALERLTAEGREPTGTELEASRRDDRLAQACEQLRRNLEFLVELRETEGPEAEGAEQVETVRARLVELEARLAAQVGKRFDEDALQWRHTLLSELVAELEAFGSADRFGATRAHVAHLLAEAERLGAEETVTSAWERARREVLESERYDGLDLLPIDGLMPLGADRETGLQEFACRLSGPVPSRDPDTGVLQHREDSAIVYVLLPGGQAPVGASRRAGEPHYDPGAHGYEGPVVEVRFDPFLISKYEVTQAQWIALTGANPSENTPAQRYRDHPAITLRHPVESVSYHDCVATLRRIGATLPTSAQWEYAARAGADTRFPTGDDPVSLRGHANLADEALLRVSGRASDRQTSDMGDDGYGSPAPVGHYKPNAFGLFDCCGNVQEWCLDPFYDNRADPRDGDGYRPVGELSIRIVRGGSYLLNWPYARSAAIHTLRPTSNQYDHGVRPVRTLKP
ncbi:MAG: SUMF1/EgtB/PvdO family nonheme iron enzyme [Planctomycetota bacterium]